MKAKSAETIGSLLSVAACSIGCGIAVGTEVLVVLLYFCDVYGKPTTRVLVGYEVLVAHDEAIIATLMAYELTGQSRYAHWHRLIHQGPSTFRGSTVRRVVRLLASRWLPHVHHQRQPLEKLLHHPPHAMDLLAVAFARNVTEALRSPA